MKNNRKFSLIELIAVLAVLSILIIASFQFFSSTQNVWQITQSNRTVTEDARIALDIISRDLENAYYGDGSAPFWHWRPDNPATAGWGQFSNELIAFVSSTHIPPNTDCISKLCEIKYQKHYTTAHDSNEGWLERSVTGDRLTSPVRINSRWNFFNNITVSYGTDTSAFTANSDSSDDYQKLIPFVTDFKVDCYDKADAEILPNNQTSTTGNLTPSNFPYSVVITITLLDSSSWQKWIGMSGTAADSFKENKQQTFTRTVLIGNRGQD